MRYLLACLVVALFAFTASAQEPQMYVGVAGGYGWEQFDQDDVWAGIGADPDEVKGSFAGHIFLGYNYSENMAFEADFGYYWKWEPDEDIAGSPELNLMAVYLQAKYLFTTGTWRPFIIGGIGYGWFEGDGFMIPDEDGALDEKQSGLLARVGGGVQGPISDTIMLIADAGYVFTFGDIEDWDFVDIRVGVAMGF